MFSRLFGLGRSTYARKQAAGAPGVIPEFVAEEGFQEAVLMARLKEGPAEPRGEQAGEGEVGSEQEDPCQG
jgi:hypothetical protein